MHGIRPTIWLHLIGAGMLLCGCQREPALPPGMPALYPVELTILQDGAPVTFASVRLIPEDGNSPWSSGGSTDESGVAAIRTHGKYPGVPSGKYKVTITKIESSVAVKTNDDPLEQAATGNDVSYDLVAPKYSLPSQTPLQLEVTTSDNRQEFDLGAAVRIKRKGPPS